MKSPRPSETQPSTTPTETPTRPDTKALEGNLWHTLPLDIALAQLGVSQGGLTTAEANSRREKYGPNELEEKGGRTVWHILWEQGSSVMIVILLIAGVLALFGDLSISMIKRQVGVKDTGTFFRGHGGMLDRLDSLLFTLPFIYQALILFARTL